jgi:Type III flagellar switch regulator (C-ring) FliN C-term
LKEQVRDWLPPCALEGEALACALAAVCREALETWLPTAAIGVTGLKAHPDASLSALENAWRGFNGQLAVRASRPSMLRLAERALAIRLGHVTVSAADTEVLLLLAGRIVNDVLTTLSERLASDSRGGDGVPRTGGDLGGLVLFSVDEGRDQLLEVAVPISRAIARLRAFAPASRAAARLDSLADAVGSATTTVNVALGEARMPLIELRGLAPGDVVVLDRPARLGVSLVTRGAGREIARAAVSSSAGEIALTVLHPGS